MDVHRIIAFLFRPTKILNPIDPPPPKKTKQVDSILCMGVDFMAESVRATLDSNGLKHVPVYRLAEQKIGCSLAEAAERQAYAAFLHQAAQTEKSLHVVYINTSLVTKARAQETVRGWQFGGLWWVSSSLCSSMMPPDSSGRIYTCHRSPPSRAPPPTCSRLFSRPSRRYFHGTQIG